MSLDISSLQPAIRYLGEIKELLFDQTWARQNPDNLELYYVYRDLAQNPQDREKISQANLRYDITILRPLLLGREYNKTAGHDHPLVPQTDLTYPEIYEVLSGRAIFLLQDSAGDQIKDVYALKARPGDKVIIPPNYEHLIINPSEQEELKTANWISRQFSSNIYKPFRSKHGFSYYALKNKTEINWQPNKHYQQLPSLRLVQSNQGLERFKIRSQKEIYSLVEDLSKLDFLNHPAKYWS